MTQPLDLDAILARAEAPQGPWSDAAFAAAARTDVPALVAAIRELQVKYDAKCEARVRATQALEAAQARIAKLEAALRRVVEIGGRAFPDGTDHIDASEIATEALKP